MSNCIYKITNHITNQCYVGKTTTSPEIRFEGHKKRAKYGLDTYLHRSMRKYGAENFSVELLEETSKELLDSREIYYIDLLKPKFNMTKGGEGGSTTHLRMWVNNGMENKYILKEDNIPDGFVKGRICKFNDPEFQKEMGKRAVAKMTPEDYRKRGAAISKGKTGKTHVGVPHTPETKAKISRSWENRDLTAYKISATKRANNKIKCEYCQNLFDKLNYLKWHGEKCKSK